MTRTRITTDGITDAAVTDAKITAVAAAKITGQLAASQIADAAITTAKIAANAVITADILNANVTYAKIQNVSATDRLLGRSTAGAGVVEEIVCTAAGRALIDDVDAAAQRTTLGLGTIATAATGDYLPITGGAVTGDLVSNGTVFSSRVAAVGQIALQRANGSVGSLTAVTAGEHCGQVHALAHDGTGFRQIGLILFVATAVPTSTSSPGAILLRTTPSGSTTAVTRLEISSDGSQRSVIPGGTTLLPAFDCRAWVNFQGSTVAVGGSGNVSSVTRTAAGDYTVNFTTAMPDANYCGQVSCVHQTGVTYSSSASIKSTATTSISVFTAGNTNNLFDSSIVCVAVFR
jgi:hypothetical protein